MTKNITSAPDSYEEFIKLLEEDESTKAYCYVLYLLFDQTVAAIEQNVPEVIINEAFAKHENDGMKAVASIISSAIKLYGISVKAAEDMKKDPEIMRLMAEAMSNGVKA